MKKISKEFIASATLAATVVGFSHAATVENSSPKMKIFAESSVLLLDGINNRQAEALKNAAEGFSILNGEEFDINDYTIINEDNLISPVIQFNEKYCDIILLNSFELVEMQPLCAERHLDVDNSSFFYITTGIKSNADATFIFRGTDECSIGIASSQPNGLQCVLTRCAEEVELVPDATGHVYVSTWDNGSDGAEYSLLIKNISDAPVSFTIALE